MQLKVRVHAQISLGWAGIVGHGVWDWNSMGSQSAPGHATGSQTANIFLCLILCFFCFSSASVKHLCLWFPWTNKGICTVSQRRHTLSAETTIYVNYHQERAKRWPEQRHGNVTLHLMGMWIEKSSLQYWQMSNKIFFPPSNLLQYVLRIGYQMNNILTWSKILICCIRPVKTLFASLCSVVHKHI